MSYPTDQFTALARANGEFALKLAEIVRSSGEDYVEIGRKAAATLSEQVRELKPGSIPLKPEAAASFFGDLERSREEALAKAKTAFEEWQAVARELVPGTAQQQELAEAVQGWFRPLFKAAAREPGSDVRPPATPAEKP
ncbi:hypothetical protein [Sphingobium sp. DC-2]|uniref:hypothetical protein n=1 Tax=Sphingobium sp. DC-2 TaxID=1303256 RepID=UPI0004C43A35|nr:hypothetical protein [Sphingobium sp. DC-2]